MSTFAAILIGTITVAAYNGSALMRDGDNAMFTPTARIQPTKMNHITTSVANQTQNPTPTTKLIMTPTIKPGMTIIADPAGAFGL